MKKKQGLTINETRTEEYTIKRATETITGTTNW